MKGKATAIYIGTDSEIPFYLANNEGYLVNAVSPNHLSRITEYLKNDGVVEESGVARDTLESDARLIMMDVKMLDGIRDFSSLVDRIVEKMLNEESLEEFNDNISQQIKKAIELKGDKIQALLQDDNGERMEFKVAKNKSEYLGVTKEIMDSVSYRAILGDEKYEFIANYIEQMKKDAMDRRSESRHSSGDARDLLEDNEQWKPMFVLTSDQELSNVTNAENVRIEYQQLYLMQKMLDDFEIKIDIPAIINIRTEYDVKLDAEMLKGVDVVRNKIKSILDKKIKGEKIEGEDRLSSKILSIIEEEDIESNNTQQISAQIIDKLNIVDILGVEAVEKITSFMARVEKNSSDKNEKKSNPRLMVVRKDETQPIDKELSELEQSILERFREEIGIAPEKCEITTELHSKFARNVIDPQKIMTAVNWLDLYANPNNKEKTSINEALKKALGMADVLDVDGSVMAHSLRTSLLMGDFLKFMAKDMNWKGVSNVIPEQSVGRYKVSSKDREDMMMGAFLHDIGKLINIENQDIMSFAASLQTNASWGLSDPAQASIKHHAEVGANTIEFMKNNFSGDKSFLRYAANMAYYHQEYINDDPQNSKGYSKDGKHFDASIPLEAQYMMIVDVFDAIVSKRNYNKNTTLEETIEIMAQQGGIKILQENEENPGKFEPAKLKSWCMSSKVKFELEEGCISKDSLHFNPVLLKGFFEYLQSEALKEQSFIKFQNDTVMRRDGYRKAIIGIGSRDFTKEVMHRKIRGKEDVSIKGIEENSIKQKVAEFNRMYKVLNKISGQASIEQRGKIMEDLRKLKDEILSLAGSAGKGVLKRTIKSLSDDKEISR